MPPAASPAIQSILATLDLATRFAFLIVVGPDDYPELARWSLAVHLRASDQEVLWHSIADSDLDLPALLERASSPNPVVIVSGIEELGPEQRHARFARMNLERDVWGQHPVRVVLWCSAEHIDRLQHLAPDLFHWRSLIQPLTAADLCVFDRTTYLAWLADECAEHSDDRVLRGGHMLLRDPPVLPMADKNTGGGIVTPFSDWVRQHRRGLLRRAQTADPRYPAKGLVRSYALRRLEGRLESPYPILISSSQFDDLSAMTLSVGQVGWIGEGWRLLDPTDEQALVFVIIDTSDHRLPSELAALATRYPGATWTAIGEGDDSWWTGLHGWAHGIALANVDPLSIHGSTRDTIHALVALLEELFTPPTFRRFLALDHGDDFSQRLLQTPAMNDDNLVDHAVGLLLAEGRITTDFFASLRALRPRQWRDISRVEQMFIALDQPEK